MFCIAIYKRSRSTYNFLSKYLLCPSSSTLNKQLQQIPFNTGCNEIIIQYLKLLATEIDPQDLTCILIWDEVAIQPAMHYDKKIDKIIGFEDWGSRRTRKFADHCIVFYIRCLASGNHMPIGYGYCNAATNSIQLSRCIKEWLAMLIQCGFKPVATVCDQGGTNIAAINSLIKDTQSMWHKENLTIRKLHNKRQRANNIFSIKGQNIIPLFDYIHLQKGIRNNFVVKDISFTDENGINSEPQIKYASWQAITAVYEIDKFHPRRQRRRLLEKLVDKHIYPALIPKMKVKYAVQVLSHTVATVLEFCGLLKQDMFETTKGAIKLPECTLATADIIFFFDDLFDSFNGRKGQGLSSIINQQSNHVLFWQKAIRMLRGMEFIERKTHKPIKKNAPKCIKNWIWTIRGVLILWKKLQKSNFSNFNLRYVNQDLLENFFSQIRDVGHRNNNPSPYQFSTAFKSLLVANITSKHSPSANCKEIHNSKAMSLINMFRASEIISTENNSQEVECAEGVIPDENTKNIFVDIQNILNKILSKIQCAKCAEELNNNDLLQKLQDGITSIEERMPDLCYEIKIREKLIYILNKNLAITMHCTLILNTILDMTVQTFLIQWCKYLQNFLNKILNGTIKDANTNFIICQAQRCAMRYSRKKKKIVAETDVSAE